MIVRGRLSPALYAQTLIERDLQPDLLISPHHGSRI